MTMTFDPHLDATEIFDSVWETNASHLLNKKFAKQLSSNETIQIEAKVGTQCVLLKALVGNEDKAQLFEFFSAIKDHSDAEEGLSFLLDFFDGVLESYFKQKREARLPLDFTSRKFENIELWARQEYRNFEAEKMADALLDADIDKNHSKIQ